MRLDLAPLFQDAESLKRYLVTNFRRIQDLFDDVEDIAAGVHPDLAEHDTLGLATQAELNTHATVGHPSVPNHVDYVPVVTQNGARALSSSIGRYCRIGDQVHAYGKATLSNAGVAGNIITVSLPLPALHTLHSGVGKIHDNGTAFYLAMAQVNGSLIEFFHADRIDGAAIGVLPSFALAAGDEIAWNVIYETT